MVLKDKNIVLGVTGSIAAYKAADIASKLVQAGARVDVLMTESAGRFIAPLTFEAITGRRVVTSMWLNDSGHPISHISISEAADALLIAPATANTIARLAYGFADDIIEATALATRAPVIVAPAMNSNMYEHPATRENIQKLKDRGVSIIEPDSGHLACGSQGRGRLAGVETIIDIVKQTLALGAELAGKTVVITAGGTREPIDPVRYIGNRSSGKMGYELALAARNQGAEVRLITTVELSPAVGIEVIQVETAAEMFSAVKTAVKGAHALVMAAAPADYRPADAAAGKIKKESRPLELKLEPTEDILSGVQGDFIRVGFAAETGDLIDNARKKLAAKKLDLIVANDVTEPGAGFGADSNKATILFRDGRVEDLPLMSKRELAERVVGELAR